MTPTRSFAVFALGSLLLFAGAGCKQDIGERCEKSSDCASGFCGGDNSDVGMASAVGKTCTAGRVTVTPDAAAASDTGAGTAGDRPADATDGSDAPAAETGDVAPESRPEAGEAGADTAAEGGAVDGAPAETGAETSASDGPADMTGDTAQGG